MDRYFTGDANLVVLIKSRKNPEVFWDLPFPEGQDHGCKKENSKQTKARGRKVRREKESNRKNRSRDTR
jgi:hypothetical protein